MCIICGKVEHTTNELLIKAIRKKNPERARYSISKRYEKDFKEGFKKNLESGLMSLLNAIKDETEK